MFQRVKPDATDISVDDGQTTSPVLTVLGDVVTLAVGTPTAGDLHVEGSYNGTDFSAMFNADTSAPAAIKVTGLAAAAVIGPVVVGHVPFVRVRFSTAQTGGTVVMAHEHYMKR
jgi:hypothetical protein